MKRMLLDNAEYLEQLKDVVENSGLNWKCLDKKSVMVTGAAGMLGSGMVDLLIYLNEHTDLTVIFMLWEEQRANSNSAFWHLLISRTFIS